MARPQIFTQKIPYTDKKECIVMLEQNLINAEQLAKYVGTAFGSAHSNTLRFNSYLKKTKDLQLLLRKC